MDDLDEIQRKSKSEVEEMFGNVNISLPEANQSMTSKLVQEHMVSENLSTDGYLSDNELFYLQNLNKNEALIGYYQSLQEGLCSLFIQAKIANGKFKIDGGTTATTALAFAGEIIPEVGAVLGYIGQIIEYKNE